MLLVIASFSWAAPQDCLYNCLFFPRPISPGTWLLILLCYLSVSLLLYMLTHLLDSPSSHSSLLHCLWITAASLLGQGTDFLPQ